MQDDPFTNGMFSWVELVEGEPDNDKLTSNPNLVPEEDLGKIFKMPIDKFRERVNEIDGIPTLKGLLLRAEDEEVGATVAQHRVLEKRLRELDRPIVHVSMQVQEAMEEGKPGPAMAYVDDFKPIKLRT